MDWLTLPELEAARKIVRGHMAPTPALSWPLVNERAGAEVWVKHENHSPIGAFKVRGGLVYLTRIKAENPDIAGVLSATTGNHGQSIGLAARLVGLPATIVVPLGNNPDKNAAMKGFGVELIEHGADLSVRNQEGRTLIEEWGSQTCVMGHPAGRDVIKRLLQLDAPYSKAEIEKALYMGMNNPMAKQACEKLADLFSTTIDVANIDPDEVFAKEINDLLGVCHIAWSHEVASRIKNEASDVPAAYLNARLYAQVAIRHAEKHRMSEPKIIPIPLKKGDAGMKILDIPPNLLRQGVFKQKDKMCPDAAVRAVGQNELSEIEAQLKAEKR